MFNVYSEQQEEIERIREANKALTIVLDSRASGVVLPISMLNRMEVRLRIRPTVQVVFKNSVLNVVLMFADTPFICKIPVDAIWGVLELDDKDEIAHESFFEAFIPSELKVSSETEVNFLSMIKAPSALIDIEVQDEKKTFIESGLADSNNKVKLIVDATYLGITGIPNSLKTVKAEMEIKNIKSIAFTYIPRSVYDDTKVPVLGFYSGKEIATIPLDSIWLIQILDKRDNRLLDQAVYDDDIPELIKLVAQLIDDLDVKYGSDITSKVITGIDYSKPFEIIEKRVDQAAQSMKIAEAKKKQKDNVISFPGTKKPNKRR